MIEAPELVTATQRALYEHYRDIHRKFFPSPPGFVKSSKFIAPAVSVSEPEAASNPIPNATKTPPIPLDQTGLRMRIIKKLVCAEFNISEEALTSNRRSRQEFLPRHMFSYLASQFTRATLHRIGKSLGGQDHTTILHGIRGTRLRIANDPAIGRQVIRLESLLRQAFGETITPRNCIGRYVPHSRVQDHFMLGWMWAANLNEYAALMIWPCACECVEPKE